MCAVRSPGISNVFYSTDAVPGCTGREGEGEREGEREIEEERQREGECTWVQERHCQRQRYVVISNEHITSRATDE